jgi:hypothetical protein
VQLYVGSVGLFVPLIQLGFQGKDPCTDFRGMGLLGLDVLVYLGELYPKVARLLVAEERE